MRHGPVQQCERIGFFAGAIGKEGYPLNSIRNGKNERAYRIENEHVKDVGTKT